MKALQQINLLCSDINRDSSKSTLKFLKLGEKYIIELSSLIEFLIDITLPTVEGVQIIVTSDLL